MQNNKIEKQESYYYERLRDLRMSLGLTQKQMAERLGVSRTTVSNYENGSSSPGQEVIREYCSAGHVSYEWLIDGKKCDTHCNFPNMENLSRTEKKELVKNLVDAL